MTESKKYRHFPTYKDPRQSENLINEFKGHLFEYLVSKELANYYQIESQFFSNMREDYQNNLMEYEFYVQKNDPQLKQQLPHLANCAAQTLISHLNTNIKEVYLIGKIAGAGNNKTFAEADLLLFDKKDFYPISLKLCKNNSFVNTKNAGIQSILKRYFSFFPQSELFQDELNLNLHQKYKEMVEELYSIAGLNFNGNFNDDWKKAGLSLLPGQLESRFKAPLLNFYDQCSTFLCKYFMFYFSHSPYEFLKALVPICGLGDPKIIQLSCFHGLKKVEGYMEKYHLKGVHLLTFCQLWENLQNIEIKRVLGAQSSFEIILRDFILQVRVKPMNRIDVPGLKVNCSIKHLVN